MTITASTPNDGAFNWKIPSTLATGSNYKIRITSKTNGAVKDTSDKNFTITKAVTNTLKLTKPNGGESLTTGKTVAITWNKGDGKGKVKIELLKGGKSSLTIAKATNNDGAHVWRIPASVATGSNYKIKVTSNRNSNGSDTSDKNFKITKAVAGRGDTVPSLPWPTVHSIVWPTS